MLHRVFQKNRFKSYLQVVAVPGTLLPWCADLFTPRGGWIAVGALGVLVLLLATLLYADMAVRGERVRESWWFRLTAGDGTRGAEDDLPLWVPRPALRSHGLHLLALFALACLFWSQKSFAARDQGGFLAKNVEMISVAQRQLGIAEQMLAEQKKANATLASIDDKASNFKMETSHDPRKELANQGVAWSTKAYYEAIVAGDIQVLALFHQGRMPLDHIAVQAALMSRSPEVKKLFVARAPDFDPDLSDLERMHREGLYYSYSPGNPKLGCYNLLESARWVRGKLRIDGALEKYGLLNREFVRAYCRNAPSARMARHKVAELEKKDSRYQDELEDWKTVLQWVN